MRGRDYGRKFDAYHRFRERGQYARDYEGFPTILMVTVPEAEERIAAAARTAEIGRGAPLPILLATRELLGRDPLGMLGPVWRTPMDSGRGHWP